VSIRALPIAVLIVLYGAVGQAQQLAVEVLPPPAPVAVEPVDIAALVFTVINRGPLQDTYALEAIIPEGLRLIGALSPITLAPGEEEPVFLTVLVPSGIAAGTHPITLRATSQTDPRVSAQATGFLKVLPISTLEMIPPPGREVEPGTAAKLIFRVMHRGNTLDRFVLRAESRRGFPLGLSHDVLELLPGEEQSIAVTVSIPRDAAAGEEQITLIARSLTFRREFESSVRLFILPPAPRAVGGTLFLEVPTTLGLSASWDRVGRLRLMNSLWGGATFGENGRIGYRLQLSDLTCVRTAYFHLEGERYGVTLGDVTLSALELVGFRARGLGATLKGAGSWATLALGAEPRSGVEIGGEAALAAGRALPLIGLRVRPWIGELLTGAGLELNLEDRAKLSLEGALSHAGAFVDGAFLAKGKTRWEILSLTSEFILSGSRFLGSRRDVLGLTLSPGLTLGPIALRGDWSYRRDNVAGDPGRPTTVEGRARLGVRIGLTTSTTLSSRISFRSKTTPGLALEDFQLGARLSHRAGPLTLSLFHERSWSRDLTSGGALEQGIWGTDLTLSWGGALVFLKVKLDTLSDPLSGMLIDHSTEASFGLGLSYPQASVLLLFERLSDHSSFSARFRGRMGLLAIASNPSIRLDNGGNLHLSFGLSVGVRFAVPMPFIPVSGRVEGFLFIDRDGDGMRDPDEEGVEGAILALDGLLARSGSDGFFRFPPVEPGSLYLNLVELPPGLVSATPLPLEVQLRAGQTVRVEIPLNEVGFLSGIVFHDEDEDGEQDQGERGLSDVRIIVRGPLTREAHTGPDGRFSLQLPPGSYEVALDKTTLPPRFQPTTPAEVSVELEAGGVQFVSFGAAERLEIRFAPTADFSFHPQRPKVGEPITFDASASYDPDGEIVAYEWDFDGDGAADASGRVAIHTFTEEGEYPVTLTVTDNDGNQDSETKTVTVGRAD